MIYGYSILQIMYLLVSTTTQHNNRNTYKVGKFCYVLTTLNQDKPLNCLEHNFQNKPMKT